MAETAQSTLPRDAKGPLAPPPTLAGDLRTVADAVASWPEVEATTHWHFADQSRVDGIDFYVGTEELGHLHLDGWIHLATTPELGAALVAEGKGSPFAYARGWTQTRVASSGVTDAITFFRRNYDRLRPPSTRTAKPG